MVESEITVRGGFAGIAHRGWRAASLFARGRTVDSSRREARCFHRVPGRDAETANDCGIAAGDAGFGCDRFRWSRGRLQESEFPLRYRERLQGGDVVGARADLCSGF